ncbi:tRNA pseudouridine(13) synthase TruD [Candidatus Woesearchaeota archaeon]|nr:tRNA pseudouridine(13) synthase TruD [Candidatus Woesearchaeota archaeon]
MFRIKQIPEDFKVFEIADHIPSEGPFLIYKMKKTGWNTLDAVSLIAKSLKIPLKSIGFAGNKDKHAVTEQYVSIKSQKSRVDALYLKDIELDYVCTSKDPISLGDLDGNRFEIIVRNIDKRPEKIVSIVNYFDEQRFSDKNVEIGRRLVKRDFSGAAGLLGVSGNNPVNLLRSLTKKKIIFFIHAYQSYLWNKIVALYLQKRNDDLVSIPYSLGDFVFPDDFIDIRIDIPGFGSEYSSDMHLVEDVLSGEGITLRDFVLREFPELSAEGVPRNICVKVKDMEIGELEPDELNVGKKKCSITFSLPKGSYATLVIKRLFI